MVEKTGLHKAKITYELLPDRIIHLTDGGLRQEITPDEINKFVDIENYLLIFVRDNFAYYVPPSAFTDKIIRDQFRDKISKLL